jgi:hypothetical protein
MLMAMDVRADTECAWTLAWTPLPASTPRRVLPRSGPTSVIEPFASSPADRQRIAVRRTVPP